MLASLHKAIFSPRTGAVLGTPSPDTDTRYAVIITARNTATMQSQVAVIDLVINLASSRISVIIEDSNTELNTITENISTSTIITDLAFVAKDEHNVIRTDAK